MVIARATKMIGAKLVQLQLNSHQPPEITVKEQQIQIKIIAIHGRLAKDVSELSTDSDLYDAGLTSLITVNLLLAIEDHFDIEFPDELLSRRTFQSIDALSEAVESLVD